jgi:hypothetical protein
VDRGARDPGGVSVDLYGKLYGATVTEEELDEILRFYRSPIGQKDVAASHAALPEWTAFMAEKNREVLDRNMKTFLRDLDRIVAEVAPARPAPPTPAEPRSRADDGT